MLDLRNVKKRLLQHFVLSVEQLSEEALDSVEQHFLNIPYNLQESLAPSKVISKLE